MVIKKRRTTRKNSMKKKVHKKFKRKTKKMYGGVDEEEEEDDGMDGRWGETKQRAPQQQDESNGHNDFFGFPDKKFWEDFIKEEREMRTSALQMPGDVRWKYITSCGQPEGHGPLREPGTIPTNLSSEFSQANIGECCSWWNKTFIANAIPKNIREDLFDTTHTTDNRKKYLRDYILPFHRAIRGGDLSKFYAPPPPEQRQEEEERERARERVRRYVDGDDDELPDYEDFEEEEGETNEGTREIFEELIDTESIKWNNNNRMKWYEEAKKTFDFYNLEGQKMDPPEDQPEDPLISKYYKPSPKWENVAKTMLKDVPREDLSRGVWNDPISGESVNIGPVLSIDPPHTDDADDAFCIYKDAAGNTHIMVHIADPSAFTKLFTPDWYRMCQQSETRYAYSSGFADGTAPLHLIAGDKVKYISLQNNGYYINDVEINDIGDIQQRERPKRNSKGGEKFALSQDFIIIKGNVTYPRASTSRIAGTYNFDMVPNGVPFFSTIWVENQGLFMYNQVTIAVKASDEKGKKKVHWGNLSVDMSNNQHGNTNEWLPFRNTRIDFKTRNTISSNAEVRADIIQRLQAFMKITKKTRETRLLGMSWASLTKEVEAIELGDFRNDELGDHGLDNKDCTKDGEFDSHNAIAELAIRMNETITIFLCQCQKSGVIPSFIKRNFPGIDNGDFGTIPQGASYCGGYSFCGTRKNGYNLLHKGVGNTYYSHITSPMRRLPDLISHMDLRWIMILNTKDDGENMLPRSCFPIIQNEINKEKMKKIVEKFPNPFWSDEANYASICLLSTINFIKKFNSKMTHFNNKFKVLQRIKNDHHHHHLLETRQPTESKEQPSESKEPSKDLQLKLLLAYPLNDLYMRPTADDRPIGIKKMYRVTQQPYRQKEIDIVLSHYKKGNGDWCKFGSTWARLKQPMFIKIAPWTTDGKELKYKSNVQHSHLVVEGAMRKQTYGFLPDSKLPDKIIQSLEKNTEADTVFIDKMKTRGANIQWRERKTQGTTKGNMDPGNYTWVDVSKYPPVPVEISDLGRNRYYSSIKAPRGDWLNCLIIFLKTKRHSTSDADQGHADDGTIVEIAYTKGWDYVLAYFAPAADFNKGRIRRFVQQINRSKYSTEMQQDAVSTRKQNQVDEFLQMSSIWDIITKRRQKEVEQSKQREEKKEESITITEAPVNETFGMAQILRRLPDAKGFLADQLSEDEFIKEHAWVILQNIKLYLNADIAEKRIVLSKEWKNLYCSVMNIPDFGDDDDKIEAIDSNNRVYSPLIQIETGKDDCSNILPFNFYPYRTRALKLDQDSNPVYESNAGFSLAASTSPTKKKVVFDFDVNQRFKWKRSFAMVEDNIFLPKGETPTPIQLGEGGIGYIVDIDPSYEVAVEAMPGQIGKYENFEGAQKISIPPYYKEDDRDIRLPGYFKKEGDDFSYFRDKLKKSTFNGLFTKLKEGMKPTDVAAAAVDEAHNTPATDKESKEETRHTARVAPPTQDELEEYYGY